MTEKHSEAPSAGSEDGRYPGDDAEAAGAASAAQENREASTDGAMTGHRAGLNAANVLALILACLAVAGAGFLWWQYRQFYVALDAVDGQTITSLQELRASARQLADRLQELDGRDQRITETAERLGERVDSFPPRLLELEESIAAAQGVSADVRGRWLSAQAEYFLTVANAELTLRGDRSSAVTALELADDRLVELGNPGFASVREQIARELLELRGIRVADVEGLSFSLSGLAARVPDLPMRVPSPERYASSDPPASAEPGLGRLWQSFKNALSGMISIERSQSSDPRRLSSSEQTLVIRQLQLELTLARLGLVQGHVEVFKGSLAAAQALLETHFMTGEAAVEGAIALLQEMSRFDVAPRYPDISRSLELLRNLPNRDG
jgi:uroporphyrin-3 C-methyltransferase